MVALDILSDGFFAAVAGIGFGAISDPPLRAFKMIAILAALGHACRFCLMTYLGVDIATASLFAGLVIGFGSLWLGKRVYCPMRTFPYRVITNGFSIIAVNAISYSPPLHTIVNFPCSTCPGTSPLPSYV